MVKILSGCRRLTPLVLLISGMTSMGLVTTASGASVSHKVSSHAIHQAKALNPLVHDPRVIRKKGYDPASRYAKTRDGFGHTLYAWAAVCHGSGDGRCQNVFFFIGSRFVGKDAKFPAPWIKNWRARGVGTIAVTYANYLKNDPMCCPTGKSFTRLYHWNGKRIVRM